MSKMSPTLEGILHLLKEVLIEFLAIIVATGGMAGMLYGSLWLAQVTLK